MSGLILTNTSSALTLAFGPQFAAGRGCAAEPDGTGRKDEDEKHTLITSSYGRKARI